MSLQDLNSAARVREAIAKVALETVDNERPRARYATVISINKTLRTLVVQYPDEAVNFTVKCGAILPLANGQVVRIAGQTGDRYVDDIIGESSFDGNIGTAATFVVASQAAMLALAAKRGDVAVRTDITKSFVLTQTPATTLGNWQELLTADATAAANAVLSVHLAAADPHPTYLTQAEGDLLYSGASGISAALAAHTAAADPHTGYVLEAGGSQILASGTNIVPLVLRGAVSQISDLLQVVDGGGVTRLNITAAGVLNGNGAGLTTLNGTNISSGTVADARLPATISATTTGSAAKWTSGRLITVDGDVAGSVTIDGSAAVTLTTTASAALLSTLDGRYINTSGDTLTGTLNTTGHLGLVAAAAQGTVVQPAGSNAHSAAPFSRQFADVARWKTPTIAETSVDGTTFTQVFTDTWLYRPFSGDVTGANSPIALDGVAVTGLTAARWTFSGNLQFSTFRWIAMSIRYSTPAPAVTVLWETSPDNITWTTAATATNVTAANQWLFIRADESARGSIFSNRFTITRTAGTVFVTSFQLLSDRPGDQGGGANKELPFSFIGPTRGVGVQPLTPTTTAFQVVGAVGQTAALQVWQNSSAGILAQVLNTGVFQSTVAGTTTTGTAPFTVASSALVTNLNADKVDGLDASAFMSSTNSTFASLTLTASLGTAPMIVTSTTKVENLNADLLDGRSELWFATQAGLESVLGDLLYVGLIDASNKTVTNKALNTGVATITTGYAHGLVVDDRAAVRNVDATFNGDYVVTAVPAVTNLTITNKSRLANIGTITTSTVHGFAIGTKVGIAVTSDLTFSGAYDVLAVPTTTSFTYKISGADVTALTVAAGTVYAYPTVFSYAKTATNVVAVAATGTVYELPTPIWNGLRTSYRHGMYWIVAKSGPVDYVDTDLSGRLEIGVDAAVDLANGDWVIATSPAFNRLTPNVNLAYTDMVFQTLPFSSETFIKEKIAEHSRQVNDPHSAAGYLTALTAAVLFSPIVHRHTAEIDAAILVHSLLPDPHPGYVTPTRGALLFAGITHEHGSLYEALGTVAAHEAKADPHVGYLTQLRGDNRYTLLGHNHDSAYYTKTQIDATIFALPTVIRATDSAPSARIWIGDVTPTPNGIGDIWIETPNSALVLPLANTNFTGSSPDATTVNLAWNTWPTNAAVTAVSLQRQNGADWTTVAPTVLVTSSATFAFPDTGRTENTTYKYRLNATNSLGAGAFSADLSVITGNAAPSWPTPALVVSAQTATGMRLSWTAPTSFADANAAGSRYEVFLNNVSQGYALLTDLFYDFGSNGAHANLTENTTYTLGVRAKDTGGLVSATVSTTGVTTNALPPSPNGQVSSGLLYNQVTMTWNAISGISDFLRYRVYLDDVEVGQPKTTSWTFTGLAASHTAYKLEVRTEDTAGALSPDNINTILVNTPVNPDTTPPAQATITSFIPEGTYGAMVLRGTYPATADFNWAQVVVSVNGGAATQIFQGAATASAAFGSGGLGIACGTYTAGTTIVASVNVRDATGNWAYGTGIGYTLITSPYNIAADASNQWRNTSGGAYGAAGNDKPYQWYFQNASWNAIGMFYYGTRVQDTLQNGGRRTITSGAILLYRNTAGSSASAAVSVRLHAETASPGTITGAAAPALGGTETVIANLTPSTNTLATLPAGWAALLVAGTWRGIAINSTSGAYCNFDSVSANGYSGVLAISHLG